MNLQKKSVFLQKFLMNFLFKNIMKYNPQIHHRNSIRLKGYNYARKGLYFITVCVKKHECMFGEIENGEMQMNEYGKIAHEEWLNTINLRKNIKLHTFVVMPNHFHAIIEITETLSSTPNRRGVLHTPLLENYENARQGVCNTPLRSPSQTLGAIVRGYKSAVTKKIGFSVWQRNFYDHIVRDVVDYERIYNYIEYNPQSWNNDIFFVKNLEILKS